MSEAVLYETRGKVAILTLNRPERLNAWNAELGDRFWTHLDAAKADPEVVAIVVTGAGRGFCAGADMDLLQGIQAAGGEAPARNLRNEHQTYTLSIPKPVIAAINGACAGLGMVQAAMADVRFAATTAKFTTAFSRRGLIAEHGLGWVLPKLVGPSKALDLLMSGRVFLAEEALQLGFVNYMSSPESVLDDAIAYAEDLAAHVSPTSMAVMKNQVWSGLAAQMADSNALSDSEMKASLRRADFKEGVASFLEKRPPNFAPLQG